MSGASASGIGDRLRAARQRCGWSREELAVHSGVSWSAIAQVESGRRRNLRPETLSRLSSALGLSIDYLVRGGPTAPIFSHRALLYETEEEFAEATAIFLAEGLERSEPALAVTERAKLSLLRKRLGKDAKRCTLVEWSDRLSTPEAMLDELGRFLRGQLQKGAVWVRVVGEPIWEGRSAAEARLWTRLESLFNLALAGSPMSMLCTYDVSRVNPRIVRDAHTTHPVLIEAGEVKDSRAYRDPGQFALED